MKNDEIGVLGWAGILVFSFVVLVMFIATVWAVESGDIRTVTASSYTYELCGSSVSTGTVIEGNVSGMAVLGTGYVSGSTSTEFVNVYRLTYINTNNVVTVINLREDAEGVVVRIYASTDGSAEDFEPTVTIESTYAEKTDFFGQITKSDYKTIYTITVHKDTIYNI